jgi:hypothetical protein
MLLTSVVYRVINLNTNYFTALHEEMIKHNNNKVKLQLLYAACSTMSVNADWNQGILRRDRI